MVDSNKYSVWISSFGTSDFINVCSDASVDYDVNYGGTKMGIFGQSTANAIFVDSIGGAVGRISIRGTRVNPILSTDTSNGVPNAPSNVQFMDKIKYMIEATQMFQSAYTIRIYNIDMRNKNTTNEYRDLYVFLKSADFTFNWTKPSEMDVSLECIRRNKGRGFGRE